MSELTGKIVTVFGGAREGASPVYMQVGAGRVPSQRRLGEGSSGAQLHLPRVAHSRLPLRWALCWPRREL